MKNYRISGSDLTFGLSCPGCFYAKHNYKWRKPYSPFPSVFGAIDKSMKQYWVGRNLSRVTSCPDMQIQSYEKHLLSQPIEFPRLNVSIQLSGVLDFYATNGSHSAIIDAKTSKLDEDGVDKTAELYAPQLHCYREAVTNPAKPNSLKLENVDTLGLLVMSPGPVTSSTQMEVKHTWVQVDNNYDFRGLLRRVAEMLTGNESVNDQCFYCLGRKAMREVNALNAVTPF